MGMMQYLKRMTRFLVYSMLFNVGMLLTSALAVTTAFQKKTLSGYIILVTFGIGYMRWLISVSQVESLNPNTAKKSKKGNPSQASAASSASSCSSASESE